MKTALLTMGMFLILVIVMASRGEAQNSESKVAPEKTEPTALQKKILGIFTASKKKFRPDGRISLVYNFEKDSINRDEMVNDWMPALETTKQRIRWSRGLEGYYTLESGIIVGDYGQWFHKAVFLSNIEMQVDILRVSSYRPGSILSPVFFNEKKKLSVGINGGSQAVCLRGVKLAQRPIPATLKKLPRSHVKEALGFKYDGKTIQPFAKGKKTGFIDGTSRLVKGFDSGHAGLVWSAPMQAFIFKITIVGDLDPDWVAKQLD